MQVSCEIHFHRRQHPVATQSDSAGFAELYDIAFIPLSKRLTVLFSASFRKFTKISIRPSILAVSPVTIIVNYFSLI
jgi:hypothetical protein